MSLGYSIVIKVDTKYNYQSIIQLLIKGAEHKFVYYKFILGETNIHSSALSSESAADSIIQGLPEDDLHCLSVQIQNTYATLHLWDDGVHMMVMLSGLSDNWSKVFTDETKDIDVARYTKELLNLIEDFRILEMHIEKD
jgi:hypothetical protein